MHRLGDDSCIIIASYSSDRRNYALVNKAWNRAFSSSDQVWLGSLRGDYGTSEKLGVLDPNGLPSASPCATYREAWQSWRSFERQFEQEGEPRFKHPDIWRRALIMWDNMDRALYSIFGRRDLLNTGCKRPGKLMVSKPAKRKLFEDEPRLFETVRAIWGIHDGSDELRSSFGSISWYNDVRSTSLLRLVVALALVVYPFAFATITEPDHSHFDVFRVTVFGYQNGKICRRSLDANGKSFDDEPTEDALLDFFERYALDLLNHGRYSRTEVDGRPVLLGFPLRGPQTSEAVTQGLRVRASYCPVFSDRNVGPNMLYVYQITIDYYPQAGQARIWQGKRAVLLRRHWEFEDPVHPEQNAVVDDRGVIGLYPCFDEQGNHRQDFDSNFTTRRCFSYCSCVPAQPGWTMEGYFTFAVEELNGDVVMNQSFRVKVGKLTFHHPTFPL